MKKIICSASIILSIFLLNGFTIQNTPLEQVKVNYLNDMLMFENSLKTLKIMSEKHPLSISDLQTTFKQARLMYKTVAWLIGYLEPENEKNFNGAPLTKVEMVQFTETEPLGFQPIEALIFESDTTTWQTNIPKLQQLTQQLLFNAQKWHEQIALQPLSDREIFEAFRTELTQLFTLSLTGFDSPVAVHSLPESFSAWLSLEKNMLFYHQNIAKTDPSVANSLFEHFKKGKQYLARNTDFNSFDRLTFFKDYWQPLYADILKAQRVLRIEPYSLTGGFMRAWNDEADNLFDKDFLSTLFFSNVREKAFKDTPERIGLGKKLFFDPNLSANNKRSCASCHHPEKGYAEDLPKSLDLVGKLLERNAPSLSYSSLAMQQFWDGRSRNVEDQAFHVLVNSREMGSTAEDIPQRLIQHDSTYIFLFNQAFPNQKEPMHIQNIQKVLGAFIRSLAIFDSEFDAYMRGETHKISFQVKEGFNLFMGKAKCGTCHFAPVFNGTVPPQYLDTEFEVLGIPDEKNYLDSDLGRYRQAPTEKYLHAFKTVTVRNVALTKPYMHNGRFKTLDEVVDFYNKGGGAGLGLDVPNQTLPFDKLDLTKKEVNYLVAFMNALTDKKLQN